MSEYRGRVNELELERYRGLDCGAVLPKLACYVKADPDFTPIKDEHTHRWHINVHGRDIELPTNGPKFFDTRAKKGGGGAIDLAMHLYGGSFKEAVVRLRQAL